VIAYAQQQRFTPNLALELARRTPLGAYPLLDYLVMTSDTVGSGIRQLARYFRIETIPIVFDICDDGDPVEVRVSAPAHFGVESSCRHPDSTAEPIGYRARGAARVGFTSDER
jgi:hypothetical protein